jgi:hypothetical protein
VVKGIRAFPAVGMTLFEPLNLVPDFLRRPVLGVKLDR